MSIIYVEDGGFTNNCECPHCYDCIDESVLDDILEFEDYTEFDCPLCKGWIKGIKDFEAFSSKIEYLLNSLVPKKNIE